MIALPETSLETILNQGGMLGEFLDYKQREQSAPVVQLFALREDAIPEDKRCIFIRQSGDSSAFSHLVQSNTITIGLISLPTDKDMPVVRFRAEEIYQYLLDNFSGDLIHGLRVTRPGTPYLLSSGRNSFEITVQTQIGRLAAQP